MYDLIKAIVWTTYREFYGLVCFAWLVSSIINTITLYSFRVNWFWVGMIPFSHNIYKLDLTDVLDCKWFYGVPISILGLWAVITHSPLGTLIYVICTVLVNFLYGVSVYEKRWLFGLFPPYRWYVQISYLIEEWKEAKGR